MTGAQADADLAAALDAVEAAVTAALTQLQAATDAVTGPAVAAFDASYEAAYATLADAVAAAGEDPVALQQAVDAFNATVDAAADQCEAAFLAAAAAADASLVPIQAALDTATAAADAAWDAAVTAAEAVYTSATTTAWAGYTAAEQEAWASFQVAVGADAEGGGENFARAQQQEEPKFGPRVKPSPKGWLQGGGDGRSIKLVPPKLEYDLRLPGRPIFKVGPEFKLDPFAPPGKPLFDPSLRLELEWRLGRKPPR